MGRLKQSTEKIQELLDKVESGEVAPDWNASEGEAGYIKRRSHYIAGAQAIPFEQWDKRFDEDGNAIYSRYLSLDNIFGCLIREGSLEFNEVNYIFFGTEWKSLSPAVSADIRINYDSESAISALEIKLYRYGDPEEFLANFINNALFAYGQGEDFIYPIANEFIPNTIARTNDVDELREETTALWENLDHGVFPDLVAGDLAGRGESVPAEFGFRASGGKSIKDGRAYIKRIKGNSVVWNQYCQSAESHTHNGVTFTNNGDGSWTINGTAEGGTALVVISSLLKNKRHKWLITGLEGGSRTTYYAGDGRYINSYNGFCDTAAESVDQTNISLRVVAGVSVENLKVYPRIYDLTQMFGVGNEPSTIEDFNTRVATLGVDMNAYNEGQVIHCNTESIKSVGDNAWDEEWELGNLSVETGGDIATSLRIRTKNYIQVIGGESYVITMGNASRYSDVGTLCYYDNDKRFISATYPGVLVPFTIPANAKYIRIGFISTYGITYKNDIMISLVHSGWKQDTDAGYQPYWQDTLPLPIISKYFQQGMKSVGTAHDEIRYNKETNRWEAVKRFGEETEEDFKVSFINTQQDGGNIFSVKVANLKVPNTDIERMSGLLSNRYEQATSNPNLAQMADKTMIRFQDGNIYIKDSSYSDASEFKKNLTIVYELAGPIVTELDAEDQHFRDYYNVADFGTEMSQSSVPSAPFSADIIYQFNAVDMIREHELEITELQNIIATMQAQLTSLINGGQ